MRYRDIQQICDVRRHDLWFMMESLQLHCGEFGVWGAKAAQSPQSLDFYRKSLHGTH